MQVLCSFRLLSLLVTGIGAVQPDVRSLGLDGLVSAQLLPDFFARTNESSSAVPQSTIDSKRMAQLLQTDASVGALFDKLVAKAKLSDGPSDRCSFLGLSSAQCVKDCNYYLDEMYLWTHLATNSSLTKYLQMHEMSSGPLTYQFGGNYDMCDYVGGRYCATPLVYQRKTVEMVHGCCVPSTCKGKDAEIVAMQTEDCFQPFAFMYSALVASDSDFTIKVQCEILERHWAEAGVVFMFAWIAVFGALVLLTTAIRAHQFDTHSPVFGHSAFQSMTASKPRQRLDSSEDICIKFTPIWAVAIGYVPASDKLGSERMADCRALELQRVGDSLVAGRSPPNAVLNAFCVQESWTRLATVRPAAIDEYPFLDGLRFFSMVWVVLGHAYFYMLFMRPDNVQTLYPQSADAPAKRDFYYDVNNFYMNFAFEGFFGVDTFLWISGFLATKSLLKAWPKFGWRKAHWFVLVSYIIRYLRFLPMVLFITGMNWKFVDLFGGPFVVNRHVQATLCDEDWAKTFFFYGNLVGDGNTKCMGHLWYLQVDIQTYLVVPFCVMLYCYNRHFGLLSALCGVFGSMGVTLALEVYYHFPYNMFLYNDDVEVKHNGDMFKHMYAKPWARCGPYFAGMLLYLVFDYIHAKGAAAPHSESDSANGPADVRKSAYRNFVLSRAAYFCVMASGCALLLTLFCAPFDDVKRAPSERWNLQQNVWFVALSRTVWGIGLSLIAFALRFGQPLDDGMRSLGHQSLIRFLLSAKWLQILGKLTFTVYLIHIPVYMAYANSLETAFHYTVFGVTYLWLGVWTTSMFLAFIFFFLMERPMQSMVSLLIGSIVAAVSQKHDAKQTTRADGQRKQLLADDADDGRRKIPQELDGDGAYVTDVAVFEHSEDPHSHMQYPSFRQDDDDDDNDDDNESYLT